MKQVETLFFDLDGTLTDPEQGIVGSICYALERLNKPLPAHHELTACIGPPLKESFARLVGDELSELAVSYYRERFSDRGWRENRPYAGIHELLKQLKIADKILFVATSKPAVFANQIIDHFEFRPYFDAVFGSELDGTRTDKAQLLRHARTTAGVRERSIMVGDRKHDVIGAKANGMHGVGVTWGFGSAEELTSAGADVLVHRVEELIDLFI